MNVPSSSRPVSQHLVIFALVAGLLVVLAILTFFALFALLVFLRSQRGTRAPGQSVRWRWSTAGSRSSAVGSPRPARRKMRAGEERVATGRIQRPAADQNPHITSTVTRTVWDSTEPRSCF